MVYLAYAAVLISPRLDGTTTPLKIYSYLHANRPIVATNITAHTQVLGPETAILVEPNKDAFADGILRVLGDPEFAQCIAQNAYELAMQKFSHQDYIAKVNQIYQSLSRVPGIEEPALTVRE
jgi:glycosyltransferase involved in cell wall biosynthesis